MLSLTVASIVIYTLIIRFQVLLIPRVPNSKICAVLIEDLYRWTNFRTPHDRERERGCFFGIRGPSRRSAGPFRLISEHSVAGIAFNRPGNCSEPLRTRELLQRSPAAFITTNDSRGNQSSNWLRRIWPCRDATPTTNADAAGGSGFSEALVVKRIA